MATVAQASYDVLRAGGLTTIFGNPGSNELKFLAAMPTDFRYVLGLHEGAVISMADGFALASGEPVLVNLHAASGSGNAMGGLTNAVYSHSPLVVTAGQALAGGTLVVGMTAGDLPTTTGNPDQGAEGYRFVGYEAGGPKAGPLTVAVVRSRKADADRISGDVVRLVRLNGGV